MNLATDPTTSVSSAMQSVLGRIDQVQSRFGAASPSRAMGQGRDGASGDAVATSNAAMFANALARVSAKGTLTNTVEGSSTATGDVSTRSAASPTGEEVVASALQHLGTPYVWGGESPAGGFDCSGLLQYVFGNVGVELPRTAAEQAKVGIPVPSLADAKPGDLVAFGTPVNHIGIYAGGGSMVVAPHTGDVVKIQPIYQQPVAIRRVLDDPNEQLTAPSEMWSVSVERLAMPTMASSTATPTTTAGSEAASYSEMFRSAGERYGIAPELLSAVARKESSFDPQAVSPAGAQGLMQLMPTVAASLGIDPFNPAEAIDGAAHLLSLHAARFGSIELALAAYNAGPTAVVRHGGIPPFPETRDYVSSIMRSVAGRAEPESGSSAVATIARQPITIKRAPADISMDASLDEPAPAFSSPQPLGASAVGPPTSARAVVNTTMAAPVTTVASIVPPSSRPFATTGTVASADAPVSARSSSATATTSTTGTPSTTTTPATSTTAPAKPEIQLPDASAEVTTTKRGAWGPNTQTHVESRGGSKTTSWESLGYLKPAGSSDVTALVPKAKGPVAIGVLRVLQNATAAQLASKEFRQTLNDVNRDALGDLGVPDVIAVDPAQDPTPVVATPSNPTGAPAASASTGTATTGPPTTGAATSSSTASAPAAAPAPGAAVARLLAS